MSPPTPSHFLALPGEIRNQIYSLIFASINQRIRLPLNRPRRNQIAQKLKPRSKRLPHLALLATCRQIRYEAFEYVHGEVRAELFLHSVKHRFIDYASMRRKIERTMGVLGEDLVFVRHLDVVGGCGLRRMMLFWALCERPFAGLRMVDSTDKCVKQRMLIGATYKKLCDRLCNVKIITVCAGDMHGVLSNLPLSPRVWHQILFCGVLPTTSERIILRTAFPALEELRIVTKVEDMHRSGDESVAARFRPRATSGQWIAVSSGEAVPTLA